jgi:hypothetical protein
MSNRLKENKTQGPVPSPNGETDFPFGTSAEADPAVKPAGPDPFDPARLRISPDQAATLGVKAELTTLLVRKPDKSRFVRVHPDPAYRVLTGVIELKEDQKVYLVAPELHESLAMEPTFRVKMLVTAIDAQGKLFFWEANPPKPDGKRDEW